MLRSIAGAIRFVSRYRQTQKLNEQLMRSELEAIDETVRDSAVSGSKFENVDSHIHRKTNEKARRMMGISRRGDLNHEKARRFVNPAAVVDFSDQTNLISNARMSLTNPVSISAGVDGLSAYETPRGSGARFQDLTHPEARRVQELIQRKKMLARKIQWLKNNQVISPVRTVTKDMKRRQKAEYREAKDALREEREEGIVKPFSTSSDPVMENRARKLELKMERDTAISRIRAETRKQKLANSAIMKTTTPDIGNTVTDPLKRHLNRRRVRVTLLMQQYLEEIITCNSAQISIDHLGGAAISIERVTAPSTRGVHDVYVRVTTEHDKKWVQNRLDILAPKVRSQIAQIVNYGYTPEFKFHILDDLAKFNKDRLMKLAGDARKEIDRSLNNHFMKEMNWK